MFAFYRFVKTLSTAALIGSIAWYSASVFADQAQVEDAATWSLPAIEDVASGKVPAPKMLSEMSDEELSTLTDEQIKQLAQFEEELKKRGVIDN